MSKLELLKAEHLIQVALLWGPQSRQILPFFRFLMMMSLGEQMSGSDA